MASSQVVSNLQGCHANLLEGFPFFAAAVLCAMQAGVKTSMISEFATIWLVLRTAYTLAYVFQTGNILATVRTLCFVSCLTVQGALFVMAADKMK